MDGSLKKRTAAVVIAASVVVACVAFAVMRGRSGVMRAGTYEEYQRSAAEMRKAMTPEERDEFDAACLVLLLPSGRMIGGLSAADRAMLNPQAAINDALERLDGKTASEIIADGRRVMLERRAATRPAANSDIRK